ncbi:MAG: bifunctional [glutamate--ammonia ligase]-adenylyl-L-tyrosine phosphorylase/[glutamate--ammonia-ligase] adenylyltransferase [Candidatus Accumulibacter sp.]|jgi:glutamate-ammonia-ligase adenylyltransferase|nr:bifunctional [glutamate--ammonia ligase]-adenylyl-L-tyrosine phosphorylase/[glutamate--ammonia-ligase] adenylyltransferase [Accumulibacter sp.]
MTTTDANVSLPPEWEKALSYSNFLRLLVEARPEVLGWAKAHARHPMDSELMRAFLTDARPDDEDGLKRVLRRLRQRVMSTLIVRDLGLAAPLSEVVETMTSFADLSTNFALDFLHRALACQYGEPLDKNGRSQRLMIVGMGKLGGRELNVSSDVDYIFIYPEEGETAGAPASGRSIENFDFFMRLGKRLIAALDEDTGDGRVFRVDMRLRPNGDSGPLVCSLNSLENYFITQGREWERYAWIKARVMNEGDNRQDEWVRSLENVARPFVFRKYLDFGAVNAMRSLHAQIRREVIRKDMADHIKLGPGGIREIEFIAQVFQLIRGGRDPALQIRPTLGVLPLLVERRLLTVESKDALCEAYIFLRRLEHRLQYVNDAQTHRLPNDADEQLRVAVSMDCDDWSTLVAVLDEHRQMVSQAFEPIFSNSEEGGHALDGLWFEQNPEDETLAALLSLGFGYPRTILERLSAFRRSGKYQSMPTSNRERLDALGPRLIEASAATRVPDAAFLRGIDFLETIARRGAYLALLQQYPQILGAIAKIMGSSSWAATYLTQHPILLDEILDPRLYEVATDLGRFRADLDRRLEDVAGDTEREMDILREAHHVQVFRLLVQDIAGLQTLERLSDHLTALADLMVEKTLELCWARLESRHPHPERLPRFAVIAYGKLGGKELGYGSDLDLVFLHDDPEPGIGELYARLCQRMNTWLSSQTPAGILFETDNRLRPNGDAGTLVSTVEAFHDYQTNSAWTWEHQALTRARFCAGDPEVGARFEAIRVEILCEQRELSELRQDILDMRQRMLDAHASTGEDAFDIKQDPGGLIDVEFIVQYLVLGYAHAHPELCGNLGNIALLGVAAGLDLIPADLAAAAQKAYREYRRIQHEFRLDGHAKRVDRKAHRASIQAVRALWEIVFSG